MLRKLNRLGDLMLECLFDHQKFYQGQAVTPTTKQAASR